MRETSCFVLFLLVLLAFMIVPFPCRGVGNESINPLPVDEFFQPTADFYQDLRTFLNDEMAARDRERELTYAVVQGGSHPPAASMTSPPFSTVAYTNWQQRVSQAPASITYATLGCATNDMGWVIISAISENNTAQFVRMPGTDYFVDCVSTVRPPLPDNAAWLMEVTFAAGAISAAQAIGNIVVATDSVYTVTQNTTTNSATQWYIAAGGRIVVASGITLTLGSCPVAGAYQIFDAMGDAPGSVTGSVRFTTSACEYVLPEWWGADPTGVVDATQQFAQALKASRLDTPVHCNGDFRITSPALTGTPKEEVALLFVGGEQILGKFQQNSAAGANIYPCRLAFYGEGIAIGLVNDTSSRPNIYLENVQVRDIEATGNVGLDFWAARGTQVRNVAVMGFNVGMWLGALYYYSNFENVIFSGSREYCVDMSGSSANGGYINLRCNTTGNTTALGGVRIGLKSGLYGTGRGLTLRGTIETASGIALQVARQRGMYLDVYLEQYGFAEHHSQIGIATFSRVSGSSLNITTNWSGNAGEPNLPFAIRFFGGGPADTSPGHNNNITGFVGGRYDTPLQIDADAGIWGFNTGGLRTLNDQQNVYGLYTSGVKISNNIITHGNSPTIADLGRGSTGEGAVWRVGDVVWQHGGATGGLTNVLRIVTAEGNPPPTTGGVAAFLWPSLLPLNIVNTDTTPSVKQNQVYITKLRLDTGGAAITNFLDGLGGQCIWIKSEGTRTIANNATIVLKGGTDFVMTANDTLQLCLESGVWYEWARNDW